jgi:hypothetical protein
MPLASKDDFAIDQYGKHLCTLCWLFVVDDVPRVSHGRLYWVGRRVHDGVPGDLLAWHVDGGEICPVLSPISFCACGSAYSVPLRVSCN